MTDEEIEKIDKVPFEFEQASRLFEHALHEDTVFNERLNFFAVFESLLLVTTAAMFSSRELVASSLPVSFSALGIVVTLIWMWIQHRQRKTVDVLATRSKFHVPEYNETRILKQGKRIKKPWMSSSKLLAYVVPSVVLAMWFALTYTFLGIQRQRAGDGWPAPTQGSTKEQKRDLPNPPATVKRPPIKAPQPPSGTPRP